MRADVAVHETMHAVSDPVDEALARAEGTFRSPRMFDAAETDAVEGIVRWKAAKSLWIAGMTLAALIGGPICFTCGALALFLALSLIHI